MRGAVSNVKATALHRLAEKLDPDNARASSISHDDRPPASTTPRRSIGVSEGASSNRSGLQTPAAVSRPRLDSLEADLELALREAENAANRAGIAHASTLQLKASRSIAASITVNALGTTHASRHRGKSGWAGFLNVPATTPVFDKENETWRRKKRAQQNWKKAALTVRSLSPVGTFRAAAVEIGVVCPVCD